MMRGALLVLVAVSAAGCNTVWHNPAGGAAAVSCLDRPHCDRVWAAAQAEVMSLSNYRIRLATDAVIETFGPLKYGSGVAFALVRTFSADGSGRIAIRALCDATIYGCISDPAPLAAEMARRLQAVR